MSKLDIWQMLSAIESISDENLSILQAKIERVMSERNSPTSTLAIMATKNTAAVITIPKSREDLKAYREGHNKGYEDAVNEFKTKFVDLFFYHWYQACGAMDGLIHVIQSSPGKDTTQTIKTLSGDLMKHLKELEASMDLIDSQPGRLRLDRGSLAMPISQMGTMEKLTAKFFRLGGKDVGLAYLREAAQNEHFIESKSLPVPKVKVRGRGPGQLDAVTKLIGERAIGMVQKYGRKWGVIGEELYKKWKINPPAPETIEASAFNRLSEFTEDVTEKGTTVTGTIFNSEKLRVYIRDCVSAVENNPQLSGNNKIIPRVDLLEG